MADERSPRDVAPPPPKPDSGPKEFPEMEGGSVTFDDSGHFRGAEVETGHGAAKYEPEHATTSTTRDGNLAEANRAAITAALDYLRQALDNLGRASTSEDAIQQITSVYTMANNLVDASGAWEPGLDTEFSAWLPYQMVNSEAYDAYRKVRDTIYQAGYRVHTAATDWASRNPGQRLSGDTVAGLSGDQERAAAQGKRAARAEIIAPLKGISTALVSEIAAANQTIKENNEFALGRLKEAADNLADATDNEIIVRDAGTVVSMVNYLLYGHAAWGPELEIEERAWIDLQTTGGTLSAKASFAEAARKFLESAAGMVSGYPYRTLRGWPEAPLQEFLQASRMARSPVTTP